METPERLISFKRRDEIYLVKEQDIVFFESQKQKTIVNTADGTKFSIIMPIKKLVTLINSEQFFLTNPAHLVNINYIRKIVKKGNYISGVELKNSTIVPLSTQKKGELLKVLNPVSIKSGDVVLLRRQKKPKNKETQGTLEI